MKGKTDKRAGASLQNSGSLYRMTAFSYSKPLKKIMAEDLYSCGPDDRVRKVAGEMAERRISSVVVTDKEARPVGIVTERDIVRKVVVPDACGNSELLVSDIMTPDPVCLSTDDTLFDALSVIQKYSVKHLPITESGRTVGIITMRQIMKIRYSEPLIIIGQLQGAETSTDFKKIRQNLIPLVQEKLSSNTDPVDIVSMLSLVNANIHKRLLEKAIKEQGKSPSDFCFFVTGSHGREENLLFPDQDFCVIIDDYSNADYEKYDRYFAGVSQVFSDALNKAGFPYCKGNIMGQNPGWRKRVSEWKEFTSECFNKTGAFTVRYMTLLFDSAPLLGNTSLFDKYINHAYEELSKSHNILRLMHDEEEGLHKVPLGWFSTFITEKEEEHKGEIDMKRSGLIFIIETTRILAMKHGIRETSTLKRLQALVHKGVINKDDSEYFENAYRVILHHTLHAQTDNYLSKGTADYFLNPYLLSHRNREILKEAFKAISRLQDIVGSEFGELIL